MNRRVYLINILALILMTTLALVGCYKVENYNNADYYESEEASAKSVEHEDASDAFDKSSENISTIDNISNKPISYIQENLFLGATTIDFLEEMGGAEMAWYFYIFDYWRLGNGVDGHFVDYVGIEAFNDWARHTSRQREWREPSLLHMIEYFGLTPQDLITAQEIAVGRPMSEQNILIERARIIRQTITPMTGAEIGIARAVGYLYIDGLGAINMDELNGIGLWEVLFSISDIQAIFSNDVEQIWNAFPGYGIFYNGRAYSPEWIFQNISAAIHEHQLPLYEIERVFETAHAFGATIEIISNAEAIFMQELELTRRSASE